MTKFEAGLIRQMRGRVTDLELALMDPVDSVEIQQRRMQIALLVEEVCTSVLERIEGTDFAPLAGVRPGGVLNA